VKLSTRGALAALLALAVAALCIRLGFWQLDRLEQRRGRNAAVEAATALPEVELPDSFASVARDPEAYIYRRVRLRGEYDAPREVVLRGRGEGGNPGVHLTTPLLLGGGRAVMVNRGWVPAPDAATVDVRPFVEPGLRDVEGIFLPAPATGDAEPLDVSVAGTTLHSYARLPLASLRAAAPYDLLPLYVQQLAGTPPPGPLPKRVAVPPLDEGPHLGYAVQWFSFAAIALGGLLLLLARNRRGVR
jgi:surfeit locus 1 family protein